MSREEIYTQCVHKIAKTNCLLLEAATGYGKTKTSIDLTNHLLSGDLNLRNKKIINILILVAKRVHKQTWKDEIAKWGGINHPSAEINICMECYESLKNHCCEEWDVVLADEVHHIGSEMRLGFFKTIKFGYFIGLSATITRNLKFTFKYHYHADIVSCNLVEAIEDEVLPEPEILLFPLQLDNTEYTESYEMFPKAKGQVIYDDYKNKWKYIKNRQHVILSCTQKQKSNEFNSECLKLKNRFNMTRNEGVKNLWLQKCGQRLEFYSECKIPVVEKILKKLQKFRTITFCKTISQAERVGRWCIHSKNSDADLYYNDFNAKKINHITAVNILNENANLVDCKYAVFANLSGSETVQIQRTGRSLRHKHPTIIIPYYEGTREQELVEKWLSDFNKDYIKVIHSIEEI